MMVELSKVPEQIKDQFGSEQTTALLVDINDRLYISDLRAIPHILFLIETKSLPPHDFIQSIIQNVKVNEKEAKAIAREIKEKVLEPMRYALFQWGVDISDIKVHDALTLKEIAPEETKERLEEKKIDISDIGEEDKNVSIPIQKSDIKEDAEKKREQDPNEPFIIQEEKSQPAPAEDRKSILKSISIPLGFFKPKSAASQISRSVKAEVETPNQAPKNQARVVHYSELRTSFSPFDGTDFLNQKKPEEIKSGIRVQVEKSAPETIPTPTETKNIPIHNVDFVQKTVEKSNEEKVGILGTIKKNEPRMDGNVIDLRA